MLILNRLIGAVRGWRAIVLGRTDWQDHFLLDRRGLVEALIIYALFGLLFSLAVQAGAMSWLSILVSVAALMLYPLGLAIAAWLTGAMLRGIDPIRLTVAGTYALIGFVAAGTLAAFLSPVWLALGFIVTAILMVRLGQVAGAMNLASAIAFAALVTVLLVGLPISLYMLASFDLPPA